ncbi:MAG: oligosaccharide flippase family protein [Candidatus Margulisiibacteriota bacterium]
MKKPVSFRFNVLVTSISQFYISLIGIVIMPLYVNYMGIEAYGLIGFFGMLQAWFQLLDVGLSPTMARETARYNGGDVKSDHLWHLLRVLTYFFLGTAGIGAVVMILSSNYLSQHWLKVQTLSVHEIKLSMILISLIITLRWVACLYRSVVTGFEQFGWLSSFNFATTTARFILVLPVLIWISAAPSTFFAYQLIVAVLELTVLSLYAYRLMPALPEKPNWKLETLKPILGFSLGIAFTSGINTFILQTDKLILSKLLSLSDYAYFTLGVICASGVLLATSPISAPIIPRLTNLNAQKDHTQFIRLYRNTTQFVGVIALPLAWILAFFAHPILLAWTNNALVAQNAAITLTLYALGNGLFALIAFPFYLQFAKGDIKLHILGSGLLITVLIPAFIWSTLHFGVMGAGATWLCVTLAYLLFWTPLVHNRFFKDLHWKWLFSDILPLVVLSGLSTWVIAHFIHLPANRFWVVGFLGLITMTVIGITAMGSSFFRTTLLSLKTQLINRLSA